MPRWISTAIMMVLVGVGCGLGCGEQRSGTGALPPPPAAGPPGLGSPNSYLREPSFTEFKPSLSGAEIDPQMPQNRLTIVGDAARFSPAFDTNTNEQTTAAYAGYRFWLDGYSGEAKVYLDWDTPPVAADLWVGVGNFDQRLWDWFNPADVGQVDFGALEPYFDYLGEFMVVVVVVGEATATLDGIHVGPLPQVWMVDATAAPGGDGKTWDTAYSDLQVALQTCNNGDEIWIAAGTYTTGPTRDDVFTLKSGMQLYGGFAGSEVVREARDWQANTVSLSADIGVQGDPTDNCYNVLVGASGNIIDGLTLCDGYADGEDYQGRTCSGGGLYVDNQDVIVRNCTFINNYARRSGGALSADSRITSEFINCAFVSNTAGESAGAAYIAGGSSQFPNSLRDCTFSNNACTWYGGGLSYSGYLTTTECEFSDNMAGSNGGAIGTNSSSICIISNCSFVRNQAVAGGALYSYKINCISSEFYGNHAIDGGAIYADMSTGNSLKNCVLAGNTAENGGAIYLYISSIYCLNCSIEANNATSGSGVYIHGGSTSTFSNLALWDNGTSSGQDQVAGVSIKATYENCNILNCGGSGAGWNTALGTDGGGNLAMHPAFVRLPASGGDGLWGTPDDDYGNLRLLAGSPGIDAGRNETSSVKTSFDCAGLLRYVDDPATQDTGVGTAPFIDIGAYEFQP